MSDVFGLGVLTQRRGIQLILKSVLLTFHKMKPKAKRMKKSFAGSCLTPGNGMSSMMEENLGL